MSLLQLTSPDGRSIAAVSTFGARIVRWTCGGRERIFTPAALADDERTAPHGGVPVLHPQFGFFGGGRKHGLVRDREWKIKSHCADAATLSVQLGADVADGAPYDVELHVVLSNTTLSMELVITNAGHETVEFTCGLHTYLRVDEIADSVLLGLERTPYLDALENLAISAPSNEDLSAPINVDRVYVDAPMRLQLDCRDASLAITQSGFADTVVWNPGALIASGFTDLAGDEWRQFVCVEAAQIKPAVQLAAGARWCGSQRLEAIDL